MPSEVPSDILYQFAPEVIKDAQNDHSLSDKQRLGLALLMASLTGAGILGATEL